MLKNEEITTPELQSHNSIENGKNINTIGIEFFCGECCKKVINGQFIFFIPGFISLLPPVGEHLILKIFSDGELVEVQKLTSILVAIDKLCAIEGNPQQVWSTCDKYRDPTIL